MLELTPLTEKSSMSFDPELMVSDAALLPYALPCVAICVMFKEYFPFIVSEVALTKDT